MMIFLMLTAVIAGTALSYTHILSAALIAGCLSITQTSLIILLFLIGFDIGNNRESLRALIKADRNALLIPAGTIIGTLAGGFVVSLITSLSANEGMAIAAGFGWHSLSGIMLAEMKGSDIGAIAFLSNVFRENIAILSMPLLAKMVGSHAAIATGGATTMDVTLPVIEKFCGKNAAILGFINGVILSTLVPIILPLF
ncbi:protein of unknown function DUF340 membrane [Denitrovibrio acetiphilus DSM 12809]|uniref:Uncharacterized protein n=1 Tax=Denitrovibrio acetiphilus (strain DSM 12809 / NBRC 114555 / N2460) TaxID=522772 RepID=D4H2C4_DENA2|nr:lysine exporter LysO family protein [Denitrovibrio acetiphilus]ADD68915.1 protein of unknown function DUF340 membrane [Denitrovibrio acetiphilus DSM 12809]